ncbi:Golgi SNAP receptor complex member 1-like [Danio aesculapii]|uniref:Golgi SNAP receptor complex member 1-like n=1 Tax=Danio aesculapii TaxID=1142201 RepID=UPI0024C0B475|nr:Golgi SNAP receptor complex member 1-like [Danio aesculapii]
MAGGNSNYWEDLRKQARQLENELDLKLVSFSKLCTSYSSSRDGRRGDSSSDTTPLLCNSTQDRMFETMSVEIEQLLAKLTGVNDKMAEYTSTPGVTSLNAALMHTLQRHRDILQDYTHEFHKTKSNFMAIREREDLLGSVRKTLILDGSSFSQATAEASPHSLSSCGACRAPLVTGLPIDQQHTAIEMSAGRNDKAPSVI